MSETTYSAGWRPIRVTLVTEPCCAAGTNEEKTDRRWHTITIAGNLRRVILHVDSIDEQEVPTDEKQGRSDLGAYC